jgi:hypothetical protein
MSSALGPAAYARGTNRIPGVLAPDGAAGSKGGRECSRSSSMAGEAKGW